MRKLLLGWIPHEHRWGRWRPYTYTGISWRSRCWCGAEVFTRGAHFYEERPRRQDVPV